jgi:hypothetical protein
MKRYLTTILLFMPALSFAQQSGVEITPFVGYRFGGTFESELASVEPVEYEMEDSASFGLILNFRHKANTQWEILYSQQASEALYIGPDDPNAPDPVVDVDIHVLQLGGTYQGDGDRMRPFLSATLGGTHIRAESNGSQDDTFFSGSIGVGMMFLPSARVGIRVEARAYGTLLDSDSEIFCETGPDQNICAVRLDGNLLSQVETFAGITFRF